jgi:ABC-2 type transport system permease protein
VSSFEAVLAYVGAAATKSVVLGLVILATAALIVPIHIEHPLAMIAFLILISATFCLFGFIIGVMSNNFEQMQVVPMLIVTPLTFLGGAFYSINMLPPTWQAIAHFNPVVYLISGFRWSFFGKGDVAIEVSLAATFAMFVVCLGVVAWIFKTGYRLKN